MSQIGEAVEQKFKEALKNKDSNLISTMRLLKAALVNERIAKLHDLSDEEEQAVVRREVKKREEAATLYRQGGDEGKASQEEAEAKILREFLPPEMPEEEVRANIRKVLETNNLTSDPADQRSQNFGKAMGLVMKEMKGKASGDAISRILKEELNK